MKKSTFAALGMCLLLAGSLSFAQDKQGKGKGGAPGNAAKGKDVFESNCSVCHNSDSTEVKVGPGLKGLFKRDVLNNKKKVNEANVREMINMGGNGMPSYEDMLTAAEKSDVVAYLKTL
jgi:cytochrome c